MVSSREHTPKAGAGWAGAPNAEEEAKLPNPCKSEHIVQVEIMRAKLGLVTKLVSVSTLCARSNFLAEAGTTYPAKHLDSTAAKYLWRISVNVSCLGFAGHRRLFSEDGCMNQTPG